jgi:hypothetical protein
MTKYNYPALRKLTDSSGKMIVSVPFPVTYTKEFRIPANK